MAYGSKYNLEWGGPAEDRRVEIQKRGYSGNVISLTPGPTPLSITWGQQGQDDLTSPLMVSTARIRFIGDSDGEMVEEVFDGGDTEWRVKFWRDPDRDGSYDLEWEGYLATDLWRDNPHLPAEVVELEAIDGLALLENRQAFTQVGTNEPYEFYRLEQALRHVLRGWDPNLASPSDAPMHDLPITTSQNWRPNGLGLTNPSTDQPFDELHIYNTAFQELNDLREPTGTLDQRTQLEGILERFGLTLMLSGGEWRLRQRDQIEDGTSLKTWTMPTGGGFFGSSTTSDVTTDLPTLDRTEKPRSRASRLQRLKSSYSYDDLGQLVVNEGFEEPLSTGWTVFGTANRKKYANSSIISTDSQYFLNMGNGSFELPDGEEGSFVTQDVPARLYDAGPGSALEVKWDILVDNEGAGVGNAETRIQLGDYYVQARRIQIKTDVEPSQDATIQLQSPLPGVEGTVIIPEGMTVRTGDPSSDENENSITLTEPGRAGDESLTADVDVGSTIKADDFVLFFVWSDTTTTALQGTREYWGLIHDLLDYPTKLDSHNSFNPQTLRMPLHTPQGVDLVDEDLSVAFWCGDSSDSSIDWNVVVDNISVQLLVGGEAIEETRYIADSGEYGREQTLNHRIGDGPTAKHPRGIFDASGQEIFGDWGYEAGQGETGKLLDQLLVEQWMRQQRDTLDRRTYKCALEPSDSLKPHHVLNFNSTTYTVSYLERQYGIPDDSARVELTEKVDSGLDGLTRAFSMESETATDGGGGATIINSGDQTIEGAADWNALTGKPDGLFAQNGGSDGYNETIAPTYDTSGPSAAGPKFLGAGEDVEWRRDPSNDIALEVRDTTNDTRLLWLDDEGRLHTRRDQEAFADGGGSSASGVNSLLQVEDAGTVLTTDAASLNFIGDGVSLTKSGDEITVDVSGGSSVGSLSDLTDVSSATQSDGNVLASDGTSYSEESVQSLFDAHVSLSASDVSGVSADSVSNAHHTRPSAGDGLSESSNTFSVNESQVDHDSLNQYVANEHVDHSGVTISAGTALSGGGDLTASRTLNVSGPLTDIPFKTAGDDLEWQVDSNDDLILQNTTDAQTLLKVDQDTGTVFAAGDVVAFGLTGGGGSGSTSGLQADAPLTLDTTTDPDTVALSVGSGLTVTNGTLEADGSVGVSSVFGRTGDVTASAGDYSASQISNLDSAAVDAVNAETSLTVDISGDADTLDGYKGSELAVLAEDETISGTRVFNNKLLNRIGGVDSTDSEVLLRFHVEASSGSGGDWYRLANIPASASDTGDFLRIDLDAGQYKSTQKHHMQIFASNRGGFNAWTGNGIGSLNSTSGRVQIYEKSDGTYEAWLYIPDSSWQHGDVTVYATGAIGASEVDFQTSSTSTQPSGTKTFDSYTDYSGAWTDYQGQVGIGTTSPNDKLHVTRGNIRLDIDPDQLEFHTDASNRNFMRIVEDGAEKWDITYYGQDATEGILFGDIGGTGTIPVLYLARTNQNVGIGTTSPSYALEVSGDARSTGEVEAFLGSDRRLKTALDPLDSALDKVGRLTGYGFDWREGDAVQPHKRGETDVGLIAQEVEGVLPEAVREFTDGHSEGYKSVSYDKLVPLLVEAIKDLRSQVNQLQ